MQERIGDRDVIERCWKRNEGNCRPKNPNRQKVVKSKDLQLVQGDLVRMPLRVLK